MIKNAIAYVTRRRYRTLIIFVILTVVLACIHVCLNIIVSSDSMERTLYKASNSSLSIVRKAEQSIFELNKFDELKQIKEISNIVPEYEGIASLEGSNVVSGKQTVRRDDLSGDLSNAVAVRTTGSTKRELLFSSGVFILEKGRHVSSKDKGKVLVHKKFADRNKLKLHDKVKLKFLKTDGSTSSSGETQTLEIVGIFSGKMQEQHTGLPSDLSENTMFADYESSQKGLGYEGGNRVVNKVTITASSPEKLETVEKKIKKLDVDWSSFEVTKNNGAFQEVAKSLTGIRKIMRVMTMAILGGGIIVLSLILVLWLRERIYEIGILLSIGVSKVAIVGQFILELIFVSIPAMIASYIIGKVALSFIIGGFVGSDETGALARGLSEGGISSELMTFAMSYALLIVIIIVSVAITSGSILIRSPKEILSKIS